MDNVALGRELRARRTAAGRTVASVATEAGLSVPYVANLENGRGNPTTTALRRLAAALGTQLTIEFTPTGPGGQGGTPTATEAAPPPPPAAQPPPALVRLSRTPRFRRDVAALAETLGEPAEEFAADLVRTLAQIAQTLGRDLAEPDWWRLLDALLLVAAHPHPTR